ncbi:MAG TPA: hypothetical protein VLC52_15960 [Anaerolineae bacterium]|nr:hypothetical protein [Anaerolineae bacterium]
MRTPHFLRLAQIDDTRSISGCRHGLVHLSWGRATIRFARDEFRRLAGLLARAGDSLSSSFLREGELEITYQPENECKVQAGAVVLLLSPDEYRELERAARDAVERLDEILSSGMWDQDEPEEGSRDFWEPLRRSPFSNN